MYFHTFVAFKSHLWSEIDYGVLPFTAVGQESVIPFPASPT